MIRSGARCTAVVGVVALLALVATACGRDPGPPRPSPTPSPTSSASPDPRPTGPDAALRARLVEALRPDSPVGARLVSDPATQLTVVDTAWLPGWQVVDVLARTVPHGQRFAVGLSAQGQVRYLSGRPDEFAAMVTNARPQLTADSAVALGRTFLDVSRTFVRYSYRVEEVRAIGWRPRLTPAEQRVRDRVERAYAQKVRAPQATAAGEGWTLTAWMVDDNTLVRHDLAVAPDGSTTDTATVVERDLPVPASV